MTTLDRYEALAAKADDPKYASEAVAANAAAAIRHLERALRAACSCNTLTRGSEETQAERYLAATADPEEAPDATPAA